MINVGQSLFIATLILIAISFQGCPSVEDPDIKIYAEVDCMKGYKPTIKLAHKWISAVTKNYPGERRALYDKYDETALTPQNNIDQVDLWNLCKDHDNLSADESWWVYAIGVKKIDNNTMKFGKTNIINGSPISPDDQGYSAVAIRSIEDYCSQYETEDEGIESVTAHEIFHQFWVHPYDHCSNPYCIMYQYLNRLNPQSDLCDDCQDQLRTGQP